MGDKANANAAIHGISKFAMGGFGVALVRIKKQKLINSFVFIKQQFFFLRFEGVYRIPIGLRQEGNKPTKRECSSNRGCVIFAPL